MLRNAKHLEGFAVDASDGTIGHVKDFYFDDEAWVIRYGVVDTGGWLSGRKVLVSPMTFGTPDWSERLLPVSISREQIRNSPDIDANQPVSRQHEREFSGYYGYPYYWGGSDYWGDGMYPSLMLGSDALAFPQSRNRNPRPRRHNFRDIVLGHLFFQHLRRFLNLGKFRVVLRELRG